MICRELRPRVFPLLFLTALVGSVTPLPYPTRALAECSLVRSSKENAEVFVRHLSSTCTEVERDARPVTAQELLTALAEGKGIDLLGVTVTGDLVLDSLPQVPAGEWAKDLSEQEGGTERDEAGARLRSSPARLIRGPVSIRRSHVRGLVVTDSKRAPVVFRGPVTFTETTFHQPLVLSRSVFLGPLDFSRATIRNESYFIWARFQRPTRFEETSFEIRARFHKSHFMDRVTFRQAVFHGMGEFLEVIFEKNANFSQTVFKLGSGFSGSQFLGDVNFSESLFEGGAFFTHTLFGQDVVFRGARFLGHANFSNAQFKGTDQWADVIFEEEPRFTGANTAPRTTGPLVILPDPQVLYAIAAAFAVLTLIIILFVSKTKR